MDETKATKFYFSCFNVDLELAKGLEFSKSRGAGNFTINFLAASLNKETFFGEFFIEFKESLYVYKVIEQLESMGACQVNVVTFQHDNNNSTVNALLRVEDLANKPNVTFITRGQCSEALQAKMKAAMKDREHQQPQEFNDKLQAAINKSLAVNEETLTGVNETREDVKEMKAGVCTIIPDYQKEINGLKERLVHKTKEVDRIEYAKGLVTKERNQLRETIYQVQDENNDLKTKNQMLMKELETKDALIDSLQYISDMVQHAKRARVSE